MSKRISEVPIKKNVTYTQMLSKDDIKKLLEGYTEKKISEIDVGDRVRYFTLMDDGEVKFRMGGILKNNSGLPKFVIIYNGFLSWSAQTENTIFFSKPVIVEDDKYKKMFDDKSAELEEMVSYCVELTKQNKQHKKTITGLNKEITRLNNLLKKAKN